MKSDDFYDRLFERAYGKDMADAATRIVDMDIATAYSMLQEMRKALAYCRSEFSDIAEKHRAKVGSYATLVENQELDFQIRRNQGIADSIAAIIDKIPPVREHKWQPIETAPHTGTHIRVLGKHASGRPYIETSYWWENKWAIELMHDYDAPTHWQPLEDLPRGY